LVTDLAALLFIHPTNNAAIEVFNAPGKLAQHSSETEI